MKISKMPGFGSYGTIITDFDWNDPESYQQLKTVNLQSLVTVVKNNTDQFDNVAKHFHNVITTRPYQFKWYSKYGADWRPQVTEHDIATAKYTEYLALGSQYPGWSRLTAKKDEHGKFIGALTDDTLDWHVDESGAVEFAPLIALYGMNNMQVSCTSFLQTADWYEKQTGSFQSELDSLVAEFAWDDSKLRPERANKEQEDLIKLVQMPRETGEVPLVVVSPGGIKGIRYSKLITKFKDVSDQDTKSILTKIENEIFVPEYSYDYWWENNTGDLVLFDQSVTLHTRKLKPGADVTAEYSKRLAHKIFGDYAGMLNYKPFEQEPYRSRRTADMKCLAKMVADLKK
jgi:hypothetical protein